MDLVLMLLKAVKFTQTNIINIMLVHETLTQKNSTGKWGKSKNGNVKE